MSSSWGEEFFSRYSPMICDGRPVRADDGLLVFIRLTDGVRVHFHDRQINMDELDNYIHNDLITKATEIVSVPEQQLDRQVSRIAQRANSDDNVLGQQHPESQSASQQNHHLQLQLTPASSQMQPLLPLHSLHNVLQLQVSQQTQPQQQQPQTASTPQAFISTQSLNFQDVQQHLQHQFHHQYQMQQQQKLVQLNSQQLAQAAADLTSHCDIDSQLSEKQDLVVTENSSAMDVAASINVSVCTSLNNNSQISTSASISNTKTLGSENTNSGNFVNRKTVSSQSRGLCSSSVSGQSSSDVVWMNIKTPEQRLRDKQATQALIEIVSRPDIQAKLTTKSTKKKAVWREIGEEMVHLGFVFENPGDKCSQKWRNIERTYKDYELSKKIPDMGSKRLPEFYAELSQVLKDKHTYDNVPLGELDEEGPNHHQLMKDYVILESSDSHSNGRTSVATCSFIDSSQIRNSPATNGTVTSTNSILEKGNMTQSNIEFPSISNNSQLPPSAVASSHLSKTEGQSSDTSAILTAVSSHQQQINKLQALLTSVHDLLEEQRRDRDAMRTESRLRFAELKSLIEQNQKEKMKFMYDFLKTIQLGKGPRKKGTSKSRFVNSSDKPGL